jgi:hypothetical protein
MIGIKHLQIKEAELPINLNDIERASQQIGKIFPSDYKNFLLNSNGGHPIKSNFPLLIPINNNEHDGEIAWFNNIGNYESNNLINNFNTFSNRIPNNLISIGCNSFGDQICLCVYGTDYGKVYFWDHENEAAAFGHEEPWMNNVYLIANSFADFINSLYKFDLVLGEAGTIIRQVNTHDKYSLPYSWNAKGEYGEIIKGFYAKAPEEVEDYIIEEIASTKEITLRYEVKSQNKRYIRIITDNMYRDKIECIA